jgi:TM2 domain-containing membrane protein YozV
MERFRYFVIATVIFTFLAFGQEKPQESPIQTKDSASVDRGEKKDILKPAKTYNPAIAVSASLLFPGGGQIYTGKYVMAGLFLASEIGVGIFGYQRFLYESGLRKNSDSIAVVAARFKDSVEIKKSSRDTAVFDTTNLGLFWKLKADSAAFEAKEARNIVWQSIAWMAGIYYYNVLDALHSTGCFKDNSKKNPAVAGGLAAIPGLGLGQIYNGEFSKAGMILMTQFNLAFLAVNYHLIMTDCEKYEASMDPENKADYSLFYGAQRDKWEYRRTTAFRNRNTYIWYSLLFYFYGIFDAVVDAHLHDAPIKMKLDADLSPNNKEMRLRATIPF